MKRRPLKPPVESRKKRAITQEEKALWILHTQHDEKLRDEEESVALEDLSPLAPPDSPTIRISARSPLHVVPSKKISHAPLQKSNSDNIDRRTAMRFMKGKRSIDARLDLHGHSRESAYVHLITFIHRGYQAGHRCVLVITGRGLNQKDKPASERGVLRLALKDWLNDPAIRPFILAFEQAQIKDGGEGAFYVLLKRKRT